MSHLKEGDYQRAINEADLLVKENFGAKPFEYTVFLQTESAQTLVKWMRRIGQNKWQAGSEGLDFSESEVATLITKFEKAIESGEKGVNLSLLRREILVTTKTFVILDEYKEADTEELLSLGVALGEFDLACSNSVFFQQTQRQNER